MSDHARGNGRQPSCSRIVRSRHGRSPCGSIESVQPWLTRPLRVGYLHRRKSRPQTLFFMGPDAAEEGVYLEHFYHKGRDAIASVLAGMGYALVELALGRRRGTTRVSVVIYRQGGVGVDDCAEVSGMLLPRLETIEAMGDVSLEVSSPGIERTLRHTGEYAIFTGRGVRILAGTETEWQGGIIQRVDGGTLWLKSGREIKGFAVADIRKARLDYSVEV